MAHFLSPSRRIDRRHTPRAVGSFISLPMLECMVRLKALTKPATIVTKYRACIDLAYGVHRLDYLSRIYHRSANNDKHWSKRGFFIEQTMGVGIDRFGDSNSVVNL
jgi:hypothetical protein